MQAVDKILCNRQYAAYSAGVLVDKYQAISAHEAVLATSPWYEVTSYTVPADRYSRLCFAYAMLGGTTSNNQAGVSVFINSNLALRVFSMAGGVNYYSLQLGVTLPPGSTVTLQFKNDDTVAREVLCYVGVEEVII